MKILLIGGTGTISTAVARLLAERGEDLTLLNRGNRSGDVPAGATVIVCDANDEQAVAEKGLLGALTGGLTATAGGITAAVLFSLIAALLVRPGDKR